MSNTIYMYPMRSGRVLKEKSPYVYNLSTGLLNRFRIANYGKSSSYGVLDIRRYFFKCNIFYFNWVEDLAPVQIPFFLFFWVVAWLFKKKIIWTHHNKHPHRSNRWSNKFLMKLLIRQAHIVIVHTKESYPLLKERKEEKSTMYFFHPFFTDQMLIKEGLPDTVKTYDLLIWGNVRKSKGIEQFMEYLLKEKKINDYRIKIVGRFESEEYYKIFKGKYSGAFINIENKFIEAEELDNLHKESRFVFFPYTGTSVLNSGALILSLPKGVPIIGPRIGAFKEMGDREFIYVYESFNDVLMLINEKRGLPANYESTFEAFMKEHTWNNFADRLHAELQ